LLGAAVDVLAGGTVNVRGPRSAAQAGADDAGAAERANAADDAGGGANAADDAGAAGGEVASAARRFTVPRPVAAGTGTSRAALGTRGGSTAEIELDAAICGGGWVAVVVPSLASAEPGAGAGPSSAAFLVVTLTAGGAPCSPAPGQAKTPIAPTTTTSATRALTRLRRRDARAIDAESAAGGVI
jgi:hypothetical protein